MAVLVAALALFSVLVLVLTGFFSPFEGDEFFLGLRSLSTLSLITRGIVIRVHVWGRSLVRWDLLDGFICDTLSSELEIVWLTAKIPFVDVTI